MHRLLTGASNPRAELRSSFITFKHKSGQKDLAWGILVFGGGLVTILPTVLLAAVLLAVLLGPRSGTFAAALVLRLRTFHLTARAPLRLLLV